MRKFVRVFLKVILALFICTGIISVGMVFIWVMAERSPNITIGQVWGILGLLIIGTIYLAYLLCFSKWANKNIWKWVDKNILNIFSSNNSISTSERNEAIGYLKQGNNEYKNGRFKEAVKYYTKAIEIDSNFKEAHNNRDKAKKKL
jgi:tetratricopeptide (TPR) repeat protein